MNVYLLVTVMMAIGVIAFRIWLKEGINVWARAISFFVGILCVLVVHRLAMLEPSKKPSETGLYTPEVSASTFMI